MKLQKKIRIPLYLQAVIINFDPKIHNELTGDNSDIGDYGAVVQFSDLKDAVIVTFFPDCYSVSTLSHECVHIAWKILDRAGVEVYCDNHEALAYLVGWLSKEIEKYRLELVKKGVLDANS